MMRKVCVLTILVQLTGVVLICATYISNKSSRTFVALYATPVCMRLTVFADA